MRNEERTDSGQSLHFANHSRRQREVRLILQAREAIPTDHSIDLLVHLILDVLVQGHVAQQPGQGHSRCLETVACHVEKEVVDVLVVEQTGVLITLHEEKQLVCEVPQTAGVVRVLVDTESSS